MERVRHRADDGTASPTTTPRAPAVAHGRLYTPPAAAGVRVNSGVPGWRGGVAVTAVVWQWRVTAQDREFRGGRERRVPRVGWEEWGNGGGGEGGW